MRIEYDDVRDLFCKVLDNNESLDSQDTAVDDEELYTGFISYKSQNLAIQYDGQVFNGRRHGLGVLKMALGLGQWQMVKNT